MALATTVATILTFSIGGALENRFDADRPHISAVTSRQSLLTLEHWLNQSVVVDPNAREALARATRAHSVPPSASTGSIALVYENDVKVLALLERVDARVVLWDVCVKPGEYEFGSKLVHKLDDALGDRLVIGAVPANDRWRVARAYYRASHR